LNPSRRPDLSEILQRLEAVETEMSVIGQFMKEIERMCAEDGTQGLQYPTPRQQDDGAAIEQLTNSVDNLQQENVALRKALEELQARVGTSSTVSFGQGESESRQSTRM